MNKDIKERWVEALRSGRYEQGRCQLHREGGTTAAGRFCCLGVLCDVMGGEHAEALGARAYPKGSTQLEADLDFITMATLSNMNDNRDKSFAEIADYIERLL